MQGQGHCKDIDNATPHNSALSRQKAENLRFTRLTYRPYSPDLALCDFVLFHDLKKKLHGKNFRSQNEVISVVGAF
jgi:hypothetical protein